MLLKTWKHFSNFGFKWASQTNSRKQKLNSMSKCFLRRNVLQWGGRQACPLSWTKLSTTCTVSWAWWEEKTTFWIVCKSRFFVFILSCSNVQNRDCAADVVNIKISKFGGLTKAKQAIDLCSDLGIAMTIEGRTRRESILLQDSSYFSRDGILERHF